MPAVRSNGGWSARCSMFAPRPPADTSDGRHPGPSQFSLSAAWLPFVLVTQKSMAPGKSWDACAWLTPPVSRPSVLSPHWLERRSRQHAHTTSREPRRANRCPSGRTRPAMCRHTMPPMPIQDRGVRRQHPSRHDHQRLRSIDVPLPYGRECVEPPPTSRLPLRSASRGPGSLA
jgi:hypothetical protein